MILRVEADESQTFVDNPQWTWRTTVAELISPPLIQRSPTASDRAKTCCRASDDRQDAARTDAPCKAFNDGLTVPSASTPPSLPPTTVAARRAVNDHRLFNKRSFGDRGSVDPMSRRGPSGAEGHERDRDCSKQSDDHSLSGDGHWFLHRCPKGLRACSSHATGM
jgi:hypothetical protein